MTKRKRHQITCRCELYKFPHRKTRDCRQYLADQAADADDIEQTSYLDRRDRARDMNEANRRLT
jgi:hypothetical protein